MQEKYLNYFDKILLDVPCLGIGVLKRKPDIKWKRKKEDIEEITKLQEAILNQCANYLKNGGEIVYSTCSIFACENEQVIDKFIEKHPDFEIKKIQNEKYIQIYQNEKTDGFFICKIKKKSKYE